MSNYNLSSSYHNFLCNNTFVIAFHETVNQKKKNDKNHAASICDRTDFNC